MTELSIDIRDGKTAFSPGQKIEGKINWNSEKNPESIELSLFWRTEGKGTQDIGVVETTRFDNPDSFGNRDFSFTLPNGPYSFSGRLISLIWAIELTSFPDSETVCTNIVVSPTKSEILLNKSLEDR